MEKEKKVIIPNVDTLHLSTLVVKNLDDVKKRFWGKVAIGDEDECWHWIAGKDKRGYGNFRWNNEKSVLAHRVSYFFHKGEVGGKCVCHKCDNPSCVNPKHLFLGTVQDNNEDRHKKGRCNGGAKPGERNGSAKLTESQVLQIRELSVNGKRNFELAAMFEVSATTIRGILRNKIWKHLNLPTLDTGELNKIGKSQSAESNKKRSATLKARPKRIVTCPKCGKNGGEFAMKRWHFDNCKRKS